MSKTRKATDLNIELEELRSEVEGYKTQIATLQAELAACNEKLATGSDEDIENCKLLIEDYKLDIAELNNKLKDQIELDRQIEYLNRRVAELEEERENEHKTLENLIESWFPGLIDAFRNRK